MAGIHNYSGTAGSNTTIGGVSVAEGMSPANVNDSIRQMAADIKNSFAAPLEPFFNGSAPLPITSGGTGAITAGAALTAIGALDLAYRDIPIDSQTGAFTFDNDDRGRLQRYTGSTASATINPFGTTPINLGAVIPIRNAGSGILTITRGTGVVLKIAGQTVDQNIAVAVGGAGSIIQEATNIWYFVGAGAS